MKLYLLIRRPLPEARKRQEYDVADGFVIAAKGEGEARDIAAKHCGDEGPAIWRDMRGASCEEIAKRTHLPAGLVLRDFAAA